MGDDSSSGPESRPSSSRHATEVLVRNAQDRVPGAIDELIETHLDDLRAFVRLQVDPRIRARESTSDIVQSACREVLEDLGGFEYRGEGSFRAWLFTAALNKVRAKRRFHRADKRDVGRESDPRGVEGGAMARAAGPYSSLCRFEASPSEHAVAREQAARIERAMDKLPEDYRGILLLARVVGLSHREIGERLGRTEKAVRSLLHRATLRLLAALEERI